MVNRNSNSPLSLFIMLSVGLHIIGASLFIVFAPKIQQVQSVEIILQTPNNGGSRIATARPTTQKTTPVKEEIKKEVPIAQAPPVQTPVAQAKPMQQPAAQMPITPTPPVTTQTPIAQAPITTPSQPAQAKPMQQPIGQMPVTPKPATPPAQQVAQAQQPTQQAVQTNKVVAQQPVTQTSNTVLTNSNKDLSQELDQLLAQKTTSTSKSADELADASWSGAPRKTLAFPNIVASIPGEYKARGYGFSVTAKITFSQQGWVSSVELTQGSGDPRIDGIFRTELRKIRVEPIQVSRTDTITKTFKVSVK